MGITKKGLMNMEKKNEYLDGLSFNEDGSQEINQQITDAYSSGVIEQSDAAEEYKNRNDQTLHQ